MNQQAMASQPFFYYNPEQNADTRQQGLFTPHPSAVVQANGLPRFPPQMYAHGLISPPERPTSAQMYLPSQVQHVSSADGVIAPQPLAHKPAFLFHERPLHLNTECGEGDRYMYPATPPLSISGSTISSPPMSSGVLPTPTGPAFPMFLSGNLEGVKEGCEVEVKSEILAGEDWARCGSPPLAPGT